MVSILDDDDCYCIFGTEVLIDTYSSDENGDSIFCGSKCLFNFVMALRQSSPVSGSVAKISGTVSPAR